MKEPACPPPTQDVSREAATWFARMRGPDAPTHQVAFEAWLAQRPDNRAAYNRAAEVFAMGKLLADEPVPPAATRRLVRGASLAAGLACAVVAAAWIVPKLTIPLPRPPAAAAQSAEGTRMIATLPGETRLVRLADGSTAQLGGDTRLTIRFGSARRLLALMRGAARFDVRHEQRPFVVAAGGGSVTARGTVFEVRLLRPQRVDVHLIRGVIDVALPRPLSKAAPPPVRRLLAGESLSFAASPGTAGGLAPSIAMSAPRLPGTDPGARDLASVPVSTLIAEANRSSSRPIRLADAGLGSERVSGRLRVDDTERLARRLSALFGWAVDARNPREIVLRR